MKKIRNVVKFIVAVFFYVPFLGCCFYGIGDVLINGMETDTPTDSVQTLASITEVEDVNVSEADTESSYDTGTSYASYGTCAATTKKGTRCRRRPSKGSIYCWQHK